MRTLGAVLTAVGALMWATACGGTESGVPTATGTDRATTERPTSTTTEASPTGTSEAVALDPCTLLDGTAINLTRPPVRDDLGTALSCVWAEPGRSVRVVFDPKTAIGDTSTGGASKVEPVTIGSHTGQRVEESSGPGNCEFDLALTDSSHATVAALIPGRTAEACALAQQAVTAVEPKLP